VGPIAHRSNRKIRKSVCQRAREAKNPRDDPAAVHRGGAEATVPDKGAVRAARAAGDSRAWSGKAPAPIEVSHRVRNRN